MCKILLSINPEHVENILNGKKQFEFRKFRCRTKVDTIVIYSTHPVMKVVAEVTVEDIFEGDLQEIWQMTEAKSGISHDFFFKYYEGKTKAVAYKLEKVIPYKKPKTLSDLGLTHPPQSFCYLGG